MKSFAAPSEDLSRLLSDLVSQKLDSKGISQLQRLLEVPAERAAYVDYMAIETLLQWRFASPNESAGDSTSEGFDRSLDDVSLDKSEAVFGVAFRPQSDAIESCAPPAFPATGPRSEPHSTRGIFASLPSRFHRWSAAAAVLIVSATALVVILRYLGIFGGNPPQPLAMGASLDAVWANPGSVAATGNLVQDNVPQLLTSGYVELISNNGVAVVIQGPASFIVPNPGVINLTSGTLTATVSRAARGFTVNTPVASIVDLGTEFGVAVKATGETDVQTFRGTVSVSPATASGPSSPTLVAAGFARHVSTTGDATEIPIDASSFVRTQQFEDWKAMPQGTPYERWKAYSERLLRDPDLVAYYTFDNAAESPDRLLNRSSLGSALDGVLGGDDPTAKPEWTTGRWPQKGALEFSADSQTRVVVPSGIGDPLDFSHAQQPASPFTIAAWVQADDPYRRAIVAKGFSFAEQYALETSRAWIRNLAGNAKAETGTETAPPTVGVWTQIVFTYDPAKRCTGLYYNGAPVGVSTDSPTWVLQTNAPLTIGSRWDRQPQEQGADVNWTESFTGRIDELVMMRRAMSPDQVREMYLAEKPD